MNKASNTRKKILEKAFELIYQKGYQTTSIDEIIATTELTKGAFYYHFDTKDKMGIAIINEILKPSMQSSFIIPLQNTSNPIEQIYGMIKFFLLENPFMKFEYGCPTGNFIQEMTPWNAEFSEAMSKLIFEWQTAIENAVKKGIENNSIDNTINPKQVTYFIISSYWGIRHFSKVQNNTDSYHIYLKELKRYLNTLKQT